MPEETRYSIFIPRSIEFDLSRILQLLSVTCGRDDSICSASADTPDVNTDASSYGDRGLTDSAGYLVLVRAGKSQDGDGSTVEWHGREVMIDLTGDTAIAVSHMQVTSLTLYVLQLLFYTVTYAYTVHYM